MRMRLVCLTILLLVSCAACVPAATPAPAQAPQPTVAPTSAPQATEAPKPTTAPLITAQPTTAPTAAPTQAPTQAPTTAAPAESGALTITPEKPVLNFFGNVVLSVSPPDPTCKWTVSSLAGSLASSTGEQVMFRASYQGEVTVTASCDSGTASTIVTIQ